MGELILIAAIGADVSLVGNGVVVTSVIAFLAWLRARIKSGKLTLLSETAASLGAELAAEKAARFVAESERDHFRMCTQHLEKEKDAAQERTIAILSRLNRLEHAVKSGNTPIPTDLKDE